MTPAETKKKHPAGGFRGGDFQVRSHLIPTHSLLSTCKRKCQRVFAGNLRRKSTSEVPRFSRGELPRAMG